MQASLTISESVLVRIWTEQRFQADRLITTSGLPVQVIRPGWRNPDTGPDFKQAMVRIGDRLLEGDVELHLNLHDWTAHGHHRDPHYNHTILHVVFWEPAATNNSKTEPLILHKANGEPLPTIIVQHYLSEPLPDLLADFERKDRAVRQKKLACQAELDKLSTEMLLTRLRDLGKRWLYNRAQRFAQWLPAAGAEAMFPQILYIALCEALGYSENKTPFIELARRLPLSQILAHLPQEPTEQPSDNLPWIQAMLFGAAGLLPSETEQESFDPETVEYVAQLRSIWEMLRPCLNVKPMTAEEWCFFRLRPANFPTRRMAALSYLALNYTVQPPFAHYLRLFKFCAVHPDQDAEQIRLLEETLTLETTGYWQGRSRFGPPRTARSDQFFLGVSRIREMLISAILPVFVLYAIRTRKQDLETQLVQLFQRFPAPEWNRDLSALAQRLFAGRNIPKPALRTASVYQGLLQLLKHYCPLPDCASCPLNDRQRS